MPKKLVTKVAAMWINPRSNLNQGHIAWDRRATDAGNSRYLELADVALRPKKAEFNQAESEADQQRSNDSVRLARLLMAEIHKAE
jgi:hypothetical protein